MHTAQPNVLVLIWQLLFLQFLPLFMVTTVVVAAAAVADAAAHFHTCNLELGKSDR